MHKLIAVFVTTSLLVACSSYGELRDENRQNIVRVEKGMTKLQVVEVMGAKSGKGSDGTFSNPYKREIIKDRAGNEFEILYYYTERIGEKNWEEGMTPIALKDGVVAGIGWRYIESSDFNITMKRR